MAMSKSYQVTLKKQLDTVSIRTNISYPLKSYLNIVRLILDSLGFRHQSFMKDNRRRKTPEFEFSSVFPTSYTRYHFYLVIKQIGAWEVVQEGVGKLHPTPKNRKKERFYVCNSLIHKSLICIIQSSRHLSIKNLFTKKHFSR